MERRRAGDHRQHTHSTRTTPVQALTGKAALRLRSRDAWRPRRIVSTQQWRNCPAGFKRRGRAATGAEGIRGSARAGPSRRRCSRRSLSTDTGISVPERRMSAALRSAVRTGRRETRLVRALNRLGWPRFRMRSAARGRLVPRASVGVLRRSGHALRDSANTVNTVRLRPLGATRRALPVRRPP